MTNTTHEICGMTVHITDIIPEHIIGVNDGKYLVLYWENAEIARIHYPVSFPVTNKNLATYDYSNLNK